MEKDNGRSPLRGSGCQPSASAADASSQSGIPNALGAARAEIAFLRAEAVVSRTWINVLERRLEEANKHLCSRDGQPCFVGRGTEDAHYRCGTVQCGMKRASGIEAASADETRSGSAEGESPAPEGGDAQ